MGNKNRDKINEPWPKHLTASAYNFARETGISMWQGMTVVRGHSRQWTVLAFFMANLIIRAPGSTAGA